MADSIDEIEILSSKKHELFDIFQDYTIEEHICKEAQYSYLLMKMK